jgi:hypothetical protein
MYAFTTNAYSKYWNLSTIYKNPLGWYTASYSGHAGHMFKSEY